MTKKLVELEGRLEAESLQQGVLTVSFVNDKSSLKAEIAPIQEQVLYLMATQAMPEMIAPLNPTTKLQVNFGGENMEDKPNANCEQEKASTSNSFTW